MKHILPLTIRQFGKSSWEVVNLHGGTIGSWLTKEEAEFLTTAANAHYGLVEALENFVKRYPANVGVVQAKKALSLAKGE